MLLTERSQEKNFKQILIGTRNARVSFG